MGGHSPNPTEETEMLSRLQKRGRTALRSVALATLVLTGAAAPSLAQEGTLVIARDMDINSLDPARAWCDTCQIYNSSAYESLLSLDKDNKLVPLLAQSWEMNDAQTVITLKLDPAAKFADGSPVESKDVKWSFERKKNLKANSSFMADPITAIDTPDAATVVLTLASPNSEYLQILASNYMTVLNSDLVAEHGGIADETAADKDSSEPWLMANSAGSGPFVLASYEPNSELRLAANPNYWREGPPTAEVVLRQVADAVAQAQMLQSGAVDIAMQIDSDTAATLEGSAGVVIERQPSLNFVYLVLSPGAVGNKVPLSAEIREAVSLAIDRNSLIDIVVGGAGRPMAAPIPLGFPGSEGHAIPAYDPERAKALLAEAGVPDGFEMDSVYPDLNVFGVDMSLMMQKVQQDLAKVGIKVNLSPMPLANWRDVVNGDGTPLTAVFYAPDFFGTSQYVDYFGLAPGSVWAKRAGGERDTSFLNNEINGIRDAALAAKSPEEAEAEWFKTGEIMANTRIMLPMVSPDLILAYRDTVEGVRFSICCNLPLSEISLKK